MGIKILLVNEEKDVFEMTARSLALKNFNITSTSNSAGAAALGRKTGPGLVFLNFI